MSDGDTDFGGIEAKLDVLIRLMAIAAAPDNLSLKERAVRLQRAGLAPKEIASICGTTPHTVSVVLHDAKSGAKGGRGKRGQAKTR